VRGKKFVEEIKAHFMPRPFFLFLTKTVGYAVAQVVEALRYNSEGRAGSIHDGFI